MEESEEEDAFIGGIDGAADDDDEGKLETMDIVKLHLTTIQTWMIL